MDKEKLKEELKRDDGLRRWPYRCPSGYLTIGVGRNLDTRGILEKEALFLLENDIQECIEDLLKVFGLQIWNGLSDVRQRVMVNMRFNLGGRGFRSFRKMIIAINNSDFNRVADEMKDSRWYHQVGNRAVRLCEMMRNG